MTQAQHGGRQASPATAKTAGPHIYVSPAGNDSSDGSKERPLRTLAAAQLAARSLGAAGATVFLRGGTYRLEHTLRFTSEDSGRPGSPAVYAACPGEEAVLTGATRLEPAGFARVSDEQVLRRLPEKARGHVWVYNLKADGIDPGRIPRLRPGRPDEPCAAGVTLDGEMCTLARWPKADAADPYIHGNLQSAGFTPALHLSINFKRQAGLSLRHIPQEEFIRQPGPVFYYDDERIDRWALEDDPFLYGYFSNTWAVASLPVQRIDTEYRHIVTAFPPMYGASQAARYYGFNLLCELSREGEYYIDRASGLLYLYSEADIRSRSVSISTLKGPLLAADGACDIVFSGLRFGESTENCIEAQCCSDILFEDCTVQNVGRHAVVIGDGCRGVTLRRCGIRDVCDSGVLLAGGSLNTLEPGGNTLEYCDISRISRFISSHEPSVFSAVVFIFGTGQTVRGCTIHDIPQCAIMLRGAEALIEHNEFFRTMQDIGSAGTILAGRSWLYQGAVIRCNYFHDITDRHGAAKVIAVTEGAGGAHIHGNVFINVDEVACFIDQGRYSHLHHNLYVNTGMAHLVTNYPPELWDSLTFSEHKTALLAPELAVKQWEERFPDVARGIKHLNTDVPYPRPKDKIDPDNLVYPVGNVFENEVTVRSGSGEIWDMPKHLGRYSPPRDIAVDNEATFEQALAGYRRELADRFMTADEMDAARARFLEKLEGGA